MKRIIVKDLIGTDLAVSVEDGNILFENIVFYLKKSETIVLDFSKLDLITTAFLNNAFGKLYSEFESETLNKYIKIENIRQGDLLNLKDVRDRVLHTNNSNFKAILLEELGEDE